jgi:hypothetical protein
MGIEEPAHQRLVLPPGQPVLDVRGDVSEALAFHRGQPKARTI